MRDQFGELRYDEPKVLYIRMPGQMHTALCEFALETDRTLGKAALHLLKEALAQRANGDGQRAQVQQ